VRHRHRRWRATAAPSLGAVEKKPGWPDLIGLEILLIPAAMVLGIVSWEHVLRALVWVACGTGDCPPLSMSLTGWGVVAVPMLAAAAIYALATPGRLALWGLVAAVSALSFGVAVLFTADETTDGPLQYDFFFMHPGTSSALPGFACALAALTRPDARPGAAEGPAPGLRRPRRAAAARDRGLPADRAAVRRLARSLERGIGPGGG
jgi:hypothetical protein